MKLYMSLFLTLCAGSLVAQTNSTGAKTYGSNDVQEVVLKAANNGNMSAQAEIGRRYYSGNPSDYKNAVMWLNKAAEQGDAASQRRLGWCYCTGNGVTEDGTEAVKWYKKAAEQGDANAQIGLASCYFIGNGVTNDTTEAAKWIQKAAEQGNADAQFRLALCYENEKGVDMNKEEAIKWYQKSATQGFPEAQQACRRLHVEWSVDPATEIKIPNAEKVANLKAKADAIKGETFAFKNLYLGMPLEDAAELVAYYLGKDKQRSGLSIATYADGKWVMGEASGVRITADKDGKVTAFYLPKKCVATLFQANELETKSFIETFQKSYSLPDFDFDIGPVEGFSRNAIVGPMEGIHPLTMKFGQQEKWTATSNKGASVTIYGTITGIDIMEFNMSGTISVIPDGSLLIRKINKAAFD